MRECGRGSGYVTHRFFPDGRCFLAKRFAARSVPEGAAGRERAEPAGRVQAEARQRRQRGEGAAGEPGSLAGQRRLQLAEERRQDPALIRASIPGRRAGSGAHGQHVLAPSLGLPRGHRGCCGRGGGCQRGAGTGSAPKAAGRKEEAAKISRWVDREEMIVRLITNGLGKGDKNQKVPRKRELIPLGSRRRSRHGRGSCAPGESRDGQNASATREVPAPSGGSPVPPSCVRHGDNGDRRRRRHSEHPRRVGGNPWSETPGGASSTELCVLCVQTAATSTPGTAVQGHGGGQRPNPSSQHSRSGLGWTQGQRGREWWRAKRSLRHGTSLPSPPAGCRHPRVPAASWGLPQHPTSPL